MLRWWLGRWRPLWGAVIGAFCGSEVARRRSDWDELIGFEAACRGGHDSIFTQ